MTDKKLLRLFAVENGLALTRPPKGFPKDHPAMDLLKCRQWGVIAKLPATAALEPNLATNLANHFRAAAPLVALLNAPLVAKPQQKPKPLFGLY